MIDLAMLSKTAEYALRAVVWLAAQREGSHAAGQIAAGTGVPSDYLAKVLKDLGRAGLLRARPGRGGGFTLNRPPDQITVLDVANAVDPIQRIRTCPLGRKAHATHLCPLHGRLDAVLKLMEDAFRRCTIASLLPAPGSNGRACTFAAVDGKPARRVSAGSRRAARRRITR